MPNAVPEAERGPESSAPEKKRSHGSRLGMSKASGGVQGGDRTALRSFSPFPRAQARSSYTCWGVGASKDVTTKRG